MKEYTLLSRKVEVEVRVILNGKPHRTNYRKLNVYMKGGGLYARAGRCGEMVKLKEKGLILKAPDIEIKEIKSVSVNALPELMMGKKL